MESKFLKFKDYKDKLNDIGDLSSVDKKLLKEINGRNVFKSKNAKEKIQQRLDNINKPVDIYAELSRKQLEKLSSGDYCLEFPHGTTVKYKNGSRVLNLTCENMIIAKELIEGLDASFINWQII